MNPGTRSIPSSAPSDATRLSERREAFALARAALSRGLARSRGQFGIWLCICEARNSIDQAIAAIAAADPGLRLRVVSVEADNDDLLAAVHTDASQGVTDAVMLRGLDARLDGSAAAAALLRRLNLSRDEWPRRLSCAVVFWVNGASARTLIEAAPDFFDWRSNTLEFPELTASDARVFAARGWWYGADPSFDLQQRRARVAELRQRLATSDGGANLQLRNRMRWWDELADHLLLLGDTSEALSARRAQQLVASELKDLRAEVIAKDGIASILSARGQLDEALRIRRDEVLPGAEQLNDAHSRAVTMNHIADIYQARGDLDEALRIRRDEVLPVLERLGDQRSRAVTLGRIADIFADRGDYGEALRIRREEELPVFRHLGDAHAFAVVMGKIADMHHIQGDTQVALRILKEEVLPAFDRLGAVHDRAVVMVKIADILMERGELDQALRMIREEALPVFDREGDARERAMAMGRIADILSARKDFDECLRIQRSQVLPIHEELGDLHGRSVVLQKIATTMIAAGGIEDGRISEILELLAESYAIAERLGLREGIARVGLQLAQVQAIAGQQTSALAMLDAAERAFSELGRPQDVLEVKAQRDRILAHAA